jgi:hypothetical protein
MIFESQDIEMIESNADAFKKPKLLPAKVPWKISPSTPFLRMIVSESESDHPTEVTFLSFLPSEEDLKRYAEGKDSRDESMDADTLLFRGNVDKRDRIVKLTFDCAAWARMYPFDSDESVFDSNYDWSAVGGRDFEPNPDPEDWGEELWEESVKRFRQQWGRTSICPDPGMYEVYASPWLQETGASDIGLKHYMILGHDAYIEILASSWRWEFIN